MNTMNLNSTPPGFFELLPLSKNNSFKPFQVRSISKSLAFYYFNPPPKPRTLSPPQPASPPSHQQ